MMDGLGPIIEKVLMGFQNPETTLKQKIWDEWKSIIGKNFAEHTKPSLSTDGCLYIWVDESSLAFEINQKHRAAILKRAQAVVGESKINRVFVKVGQLR